VSVDILIESLSVGVHVLLFCNNKRVCHFTASKDLPACAEKRVVRE
jgi:hypothetical protein